MTYYKAVCFICKKTKRCYKMFDRDDNVQDGCPACVKKWQIYAMKGLLK